MHNFESMAELPRQDPEAEVEVDVTHSNVNYKDAMIVLGRKGVVKGWPIIPGIDFAGAVRSSRSSLFQPGDAVVLTGNKAGQFIDGGYAERAACQAGWLVPLPTPLDSLAAMTIGTAGVTAMMCVAQLESAGGLTPGAGRVLVTGASGGLGQVAVAILSTKGYEVVASTGRAEAQGPALRALGASEVIGRLPFLAKPLQAQQWAGVVDSVGGETLAAALASTAYNGAVASTGVAGGGELKTTVYPFILRGIRLLGVDSTLPWNVDGYPAQRERWEAYRSERLSLWAQLAHLLSPATIVQLRTDVIPLEKVVQTSHSLLAGKIAGRVVVVPR
jgi:acrylyl-CoA reductase (NADPH)